MPSVRPSRCPGPPVPLPPPWGPRALGRGLAHPQRCAPLSEECSGARRPWARLAGAPPPAHARGAAGVPSAPPEVARRPTGPHRRPAAKRRDRATREAARGEGPGARPALPRGVWPPGPTLQSQAAPVGFPSISVKPCSKEARWGARPRAWGGCLRAACGYRWSALVPWLPPDERSTMQWTIPGVITPD